MSRLAGRVAVVTGASRGIGAAIAKRLAADGARVVVTYSRHAEEAHRVVGAIANAGGASVALPADMADGEQIHRLFEETQARFGPLSILVNNAGVAEFLTLEQITPEHIAWLFAVNVYGVLLAMQAAARQMDGTSGRIINITSGAAQAAPPGASAYSASKAAVEAITRSVAAELGPRQITVNAVAPGTTVTDMLNAVMPPEVQRAMIASTPLGRLGAPEDIADVVAFLASDDARWITGQVLGVSGGLR